MGAVPLPPRDTFLVWPWRGVAKSILGVSVAEGSPGTGEDIAPGWMHLHFGGGAWPQPEEGGASGEAGEEPRDESGQGQHPKAPALPTLSLLLIQKLLLWVMSRCLELGKPQSIS